MTTFHLECSFCRRVAPAPPRATVCADCGKPLLVRYALDGLAGAGLPERWDRRSEGMWRFRDLLPLRSGEEPVTLGEGDTPLLDLGPLGHELGIRLLVKDEGRNPTGSFKDRGLSAAVTRAVWDGASAFVIPSAGNAGASLAAYAARARVPARVYVPSDAPAGVLRRCEAFGAETVRVDGLITDCSRAAALYAAESGAFDVSTLREPYRLEGKKTMMLEIVRSLEWRPPDAIVYPTGGGTGLLGSWKALQELAEVGLLAAPQTRLYAVQSRGCAPIVRAFAEGRENAVEWEQPHTAAWGLRVPRPLGDFLILRAIRASGGGAIAVSDEDMAEAAASLARQAGLNAAIEGGATLAAARALRCSGALRAGETVVLFNTANLLTY